MSDGQLRYIASSMDAKLPYTLTKGVTATREGLVFEDEGLFCYVAEIGSQKELDQAHTERHFGFDYPVLTWPDAVDRFRYREGEPWCVEGRYNQLTCGSDHWKELPLEARPLHRLAAILCDDAEGFRVLYWCVTELGGGDE